VVDVAKPEGGEPHTFEASGSLELPTWKVGEDVATRRAYGDALAALGAARGDVVALDGEVSNSTYAEIFRDAHPDRYFEMYIAEQQMVAAAVGLQVRKWVPFASTFAAFLSRAYDFIRMAAISQANIRLCGSHAGVSIGEDGPSQMALEDLAMFRALPGATVLYPADGNSTVKLVTAMCDLDGISYLRSTREATPALYGPDEEFPVGGSKMLTRSDHDDVTLVGAGVSLVQALAAHDILGAEGIHARVIDAYSVKPIDAHVLHEALAETGTIVVVEDHHVEGGLGDAVLSALAASGPMHGRVVKLGVTGLPGSGTPDELRAWAGIDAASIADAARKAVAG
jgi:transketolase